MPEAESNQESSTIPEGVTLRQSVNSQSGEICQLHWSSGGHFLAAVSSDKSIEIWDAENWQRHAELRHVSLHSVNLAWSPDEKTLALVSVNGILLWNLETQALEPWPGLEGNTTFICCRIS